MLVLDRMLGYCRTLNWTGGHFISPIVGRRDSNYASPNNSLVPLEIGTARVSNFRRQNNDPATIEPELFDLELDMHANHKRLAISSPILPMQSNSLRFCDKIMAT